MANFTFVTHKGARPEKSELVKAHVMRESQRKRREAKQKRHDQQRPTTPRLVVEDPTPANAPMQSLLPYEKSPTSATTIHHSVGDVTDSDDNPSAAFLLWSSLENYLDLFRSNESTGIISDGWKLIRYDEPIEEVSRSSRSNVNYAPSNISGALSQQPCMRYPSIRGRNDSPDPSWISQSLFDRVKEVTYHYTSSLYIERPGLPAVNPLHYWHEQALVNSKVLVSAALFYCAYRDAMGGIISYEHDHRYYKDLSLCLINRAFDDKNTAVSDDTLAAVISMCMYENVRGSDLVPIHLRGMRQMLDMRGGINSFPSGDGQFMSEMVILQDMVHASCSNVAATMFDTTGPILRDVRLGYIELWYPQSPLRILNDADFVRPITELCSSFDRLQDAFDAFEMLCVDAFDPDTAAEEMENLKLHREKCWTDLGAKDEDAVNDEIPPTLSSKVEEAVLLAARIHFRAVALRVQHDESVNERDMKRLFTVIRAIDLQFWKVAHYVYLWILLTGGAAANNHSDYRSYFVSEILRLGLSIGVFDWQSFRQTMGNFLWLQKFLRRNRADSMADPSCEQT